MKKTKQTRTFNVVVIEDSKVRVVRALDAKPLQLRRGEAPEWIRKLGLFIHRGHEMGQTGCFTVTEPKSGWGVVSRKQTASDAKRAVVGLFCIHGTHVVWNKIESICAKQGVADVQKCKPGTILKP